VVEGVLTDATGIEVKAADSLHGNAGGLDELLFESSHAAQAQIRVVRVYGVNPPF
jgi:hypothetical protein